jgi:hypothetical protein
MLQVTILEVMVGLAVIKVLSGTRCKDDRRTIPTPSD